MTAEIHILTLSCPDRPGLVAGVARILADNGGNILDPQQFNDNILQSFYMRVAFELAAGSDRATFDSAFASFAQDNAMQWAVRNAQEKRKVLLLVSKFDHCLGDLLYRCRIGELPMEPVAIACDHPQDALSISLIGDVPFHYLPVTKETKPQQEAAIKTLVDETGAELVVLA
jgi:formyltetrahydrofolate deformylase